MKDYPKKKGSKDTKSVKPSKSGLKSPMGTAKGGDQKYYAC